MVSDLRALFGKRMRELRQQAGFSQEELAERCGLHRTYVGGIERGERNPSLMNIGRIARAWEFRWKPNSSRWQAGAAKRTNPRSIRPNEKRV